jgi:hypothetical protein
MSTKNLGRTVIEGGRHRRVIERGERLYWLLATRHGGFRQHHELSAEDDQRFRALPPWFRKLFSGPLAPAEGSSQ